MFKINKAIIAKESYDDDNSLLALPSFANITFAKKEFSIEEDEPFSFLSDNDVKYCLGNFNDKP